MTATTRAAIYTRYSSDMQRDTSSEDQARNCRERISREGWTLGTHYKDEAVSGSTHKRPGYQAMLEAARSKEFDMLVLDTLSRLARDLVEQEQCCNRLTFAGIRIIAVNDGYDSSTKNSRQMRQFKGVINEGYLSDLADNIHRGLKGQALKKYWAGGRPYGYRLVRETDAARLNQYDEPKALGTRLVPDEEQARIVRMIFTRYAEGCSARAIATELNSAKIPSPGAKWKRTKRVTGQWLASAISGDAKRGIGILNNVLYKGVYRWNRTHWPKDPDTKMHVCRPRPESEWVQLATDQSLRIVDDALWDRVKQRQARQTTAVGDAIKRGIKAKHTGRGPKYLLSGVMICADCGRPMNMVSKLAYSCPAYHDGGPSACANGVLVNRVVAEGKLLHGIKDELLSSTNIDKLKSKVRRILVNQQATSGAERHGLEIELATITTEIERYVRAIGAGMMSPTLGMELEAAEVKKARIEAKLGQTTASDRHTIDMVPALVDRVHEIVRDFEARVYAAGGPAVARARTDLKHMLGTVPVKGQLEGRKCVPYALLNDSTPLLLRAAKGENALRGFCGSGGVICPVPSIPQSARLK